MMLEEYLQKSDIEYSENVLLKDISTFRIGGNARIIAYPDSTVKVSELVKYCRESDINYMTFGKCSNVLFPDRGIESLIIKTDRIGDTDFKDGVFCFGAGVMLAKASKYTVDSGYCGMEFAYGIPGSIGGAVYMNAGAYGGEMSQCIIKTEYVDAEGDIKTLEKESHDFGYRHSFFTDRSCIITKTYISLEKGDKKHSEELINEFHNSRKSKQPLDMPSAGSVFKRPSGYYAGKLIEDCGLRGASVGGAMVSTKHCGFIVNYDNASENDVRELIALIKKKVLEKFNVELECELKFIGD